MKLTTIMLGGAALVGLGVYLSRKFGVRGDEEESVIYAKEKETYGEKLHKASMFAVGAVRTGADKIVEGIKDIKNQDMVKKGEETTDQIKRDIDDLKDMVVSINIPHGNGDVGNDADEEMVETVDDFMAAPLEDDPFDDEELEEM